MATKFCPKCRLDLPTSAFGNRSRGGLRGYCSACKAELNAEYEARPEVKARRAERQHKRRATNPEKTRAVQRKANAKLNAANTDWALEYVNGGPDPVCDPSRGDGCGISNEAAVERDGGRLEFDHIDPSTKEFNVSERLRRSREKLRPELDKCQLLCKPCHRAKTAAEQSMAAAL